MVLKGISLDELKQLTPREYRIQTPQLIIRSLEVSDADSYYAMLADVRNFTHDPIDQTMTHDEIPQRIQKLNSMAALGANAYLALEGRVSGKLIGHCGYNTFQMVDIRDFFGAPALPATQKVMADIGIMIDHRHWRKGYAREAFCAMVEFAIHHLGCEVFRCESTQDNIPWHRLMDSVGLSAAVTDSLASYTANLRVSAWKWDVNFWLTAKEWMEQCARSFGNNRNGNGNGIANSAAGLANSIQGGNGGDITKAALDLAASIVGGATMKRNEAATMTTTEEEGEEECDGEEDDE